METEEGVIVRATMFSTVRRDRGTKGVGALGELSGLAFFVSFGRDTAVNQELSLGSNCSPKHTSFS